MTISDRIRQIRTGAGLSQEEFAARIGISRRSLQTAEAGENTPRESTLRAICTAFDVSRAWLDTGEGDPAAEANTVDRRLASWLAMATPEHKATVLAIVSTPGALETIAQVADKVQQICEGDTSNH